MNCCYKLSDKNYCSESFTIGTVEISTAYQITVTDEALNLKHKCTKTSDGSGILTIDFLTAEDKAEGRLYTITALKDSDLSEAVFTVSGAEYSCLQYEYIKPEECV